MKTICLGLAMLASVSVAQAAGTDQDFVTQAAQGGLAEIDLGKTAAAQGNSPPVQQFGTRMVTDHTQAGQALKVAASADGLTVPSEPSAAQKASGAKMKAMQGASFDKAYAAAMVNDHKTTIILFEKEAESGMTPKVKAYAQATLPTLKDHLKMAEDLKAGVK